MLSAKAKKGRLQKRYLSDLLCTMAEPRTPFLKFRAWAGRLPVKDFKHINYLLKKLDLLKGKNKDEVKVPPEQLKHKFNQTISKAAISLKKTSYELKTTSTLEEFQLDLISLWEQENFDFRRSIIAAHSPNSAIKEIEQMKRAIDYVKKQNQIKTRSIAEPKGKILPFKRPRAMNLNQI